MQFNGNSYDFSSHSFKNSHFGVNTIAPRFDLVQDLRIRKPSGAIDSKITNIKLSKNLSCIAISGPTRQGLPPFNWNNWPNEPKEGLPTEWNFDWIFMDKEFILN